MRIVILVCSSTVTHDAPTCTTAPLLTSRTGSASLCTHTHMNQLQRKCHQIAFVVDEIREIAVNRVTLHGDIRGSLRVT